MENESVTTLEIRRDIFDYPDNPVVLDEKGEVFFVFPQKWTDEMIMTAFDFSQKVDLNGIHPILKFSKREE